MPLSTMQEIMVLLEDEKSVPSFRINRWGRPARGAIAKLKSNGWVEKLTNEEDTHYSITQKGEKYFDDVLNVLKQKDKWDKKWRLVIFNIPEKNRSLRDKLRRYLENIGLGLLQGSVWIATTDIKKEIDGIVDKFKLGDSLKYFEVTSNNGLNKQIIEKAWNLPEINLKLERFIIDSKIALKSMGRGNGDKIKAKSLIFEYALILKKDPKLPEEFIEQNNLRKLAHEIYIKLRAYAV